MHAVAAKSFVGPMMQRSPELGHVVEQSRAELLQPGGNVDVIVGTHPAVYAIALVVVTEPPVVVLVPQLLSGMGTQPLSADKVTGTLSVPPSGTLQAAEQT
jgi:hypothetical protein